MFSKQATDSTFTSFEAVNIYAELMLSAEAIEKKAAALNRCKLPETDRKRKQHYRDNVQR